ncbi:MAG: PAS domain S-box protein [Candidatus Competibacteraceae bacterium]
MPVNFEDFQALVHAEDWPGLVSAVQEALEQCVIDYSMEYRLAAVPDRWIGAHGRVFFDAAGQPERMLGVSSDITESKRNEQILREREQRLRETEAELSHIMSAVSDYLWSAEIDSTGRLNYRYYSPVVESITGYPPEYFMSGSERWLGTVHPEDRDRMLQELQRVLQAPPPSVEHEYRILLPNGEIRWVRDSVTIHRRDNGALRLQGVVSDITDRKYSERMLQESRDELERRVDERTLALRQSEERFKAIVESTTDCILVWDQEYNYLYANQAAIDHVGTTRDQVIGKNIRDGLGHIPDFMHLWMSRVDEVFRTQWPLAVEDAVGVGDRMVYSESRLSPIRDVQGRMFAVGVVYRDVSERKQAELELERHRNHLEELVRERTAEVQREITEHKTTEAALRRSEERYRAIVELQTEYICHYLPDTTITFVNEAWCRCFNKTREEVIGQSWLMLVPEEQREQVREYMASLMAGAPSTTNENQVIAADGSVRWQQWNQQPIFDQDGKIVELQGVGHDITERKLAEEQLKTSLREKEVLLKEIHHRVKNNLQVISSLLDLQAASVADDAVAQLFQESQQRVRSMALIHEGLYQSTDLASINFADYVQTLTHILMGSYSTRSNAVSAQFNMAPVSLTVETAIPCGLIINELVSNALKHAFPDGRPGHITISLQPQDEEQWVLQVQDDGIGLPTDFNLEQTQSLGLLIVASLTQQLRGKLALGPNPGTTLTITFPLNPAGRALP